MENFNKLNKSAESLKEMFFGIGCFNETDFEASLEKLKEFNTLGHPLKIVYTPKDENELKSFKEKITAEAPEINVSYEEVNQDIYDRLENRFHLKQQSTKYE